MKPGGRRIRTTAAIALVSAAALAAAGGRLPTLLEQRRQEHITQADPFENLPPLVAFTTVALGAFRGLLVDLLWVRSATLQQQGRYFELVQLADWITLLQPRFASIWAFHAWNLSYNVSVLFDEPGDRWRWVRHGIHLLRDRGLRYNPGSAVLYRELAWIFAHKLGEDMDLAHWHYKREWAAEMESILGGARPDLEELALAPDSREAWRRIPGAPELERRFAAMGLDPFDSRWLEPGARTGEAGRLLDAPAGRALRAFLRALRIRERTRMDPARMREVDAVYGPLDWRTPHAHAVYWAFRGRPHARREFDRLALDRQIFQSLTAAFLRGRVWTDPERNLFLMTPDPDLLPRVLAVYEHALSQRDDSSLRAAHAHFLIDAAIVCLSFNRVGRARDLHQELVRLYPDRADADFDRFAADTYREFVAHFATEPDRAAVESAFAQSYFWEAAGDADQAAGFERLARLAWERYMAERRDPAFREHAAPTDLEALRRAARDRAREALESGRPREPHRQPPGIPSLRDR